MTRKGEEPESEYERPPKSKIRLVATVDEKLKQEMEIIHQVEEGDAEEHDRTKPEWSNTVEMLLRKGVKAYKTRASKE
jgi:hypothetical protein